MSKSNKSKTSKRKTQNTDRDKLSAVDSSIKPSPSETKITKEMNLGELVTLYPDTAEVLLDYGLHCVGCFASAFDTVEIGAKVHGMGDDEIQEMVDRVNEVVSHKE